MITDNDIAYAESVVRRMEQDLATKKRDGTPAEIEKLEKDLVLKKRNVLDLKSRKRRVDDQERRAKEQKRIDDRRSRNT